VGLLFCSVFRGDVYGECKRWLDSGDVVSGLIGCGGCDIEDRRRTGLSNSDLVKSAFNVHQIPHIQKKNANKGTCLRKSNDDLSTQHSIRKRLLVCGSRTPEKRKPLPDPPPSSNPSSNLLQPPRLNLPLKLP